MKSTSIRVNVSDGHDYAVAEWNPLNEYAEIQLSIGGQFKLSPLCLELLHDALHEIFGKRDD